MIELMTPDFVFQDERGLICQLVSKGWNQINVITTKAGARRGRMHYHKGNIEAFYIISGKVDYRCRSVLGNENFERKMFGAGDFWCVQPCVGHDFLFLEDTVLISMYSSGVNLPSGDKDIFELGDA